MITAGKLIELLKTLDESEKICTCNLYDDICGNYTMRLIVAFDHRYVDCSDSDDEQEELQTEFKEWHFE